MWNAGLPAHCNIVRFIELDGKVAYQIDVSPLDAHAAHQHRCSFSCRRIMGAQAIAFAFIRGQEAFKGKERSKPVAAV